MSLEKSVDEFLRDDYSVDNLTKAMSKVEVSNDNCILIQRAIDLLLVHEDEIRHLRQVAQHKLRKHTIEKLKKELMEKKFSLVESSNHSTLYTLKNLVE